MAYEAVSHPGFLVKIYHDLPTQEKCAKLWYLVQLGATNPELLDFTAWPTSIAWKNGQDPCGFLMPFVKGKEIHQLFGPRERIVEFPSSNWDFLVHVSRNCAAAFHSLHEIGVVIGDVNEGNILVNADGTVRLIDCDSCQVRNGNQAWTCDVGIPLWTPPELQGRNFSGLPRTPNHDCFGLAVMIFKLLFMGRHPYAGIPLHPSNEFALEKAICNFMFAFSPRSRVLGLLPPPHSLPLTSFPQSYVERFEGAFMRGSENGRPTAQQWALAMETLSSNLAKCAHDASHKYPRNLEQCPWCVIAGGGGPNFFVSMAAIGNTSAVNINGLWSAISRIEQTIFTVRSIEQIRHLNVKGKPLPADAARTRPQFIIACFLIIMAIGLMFAGGVLLGIGILFAAFMMMSGGTKPPQFQTNYNMRKAALEKANVEMRRIFQELAQVPGQYSSEFAKRHSELRATYQRLTQLDRERTQEMQKLEQKKRDLQLRAFLIRQLVRQANIHGIGPGRKDTLRAYGIESAWDVRPGLSVPGIGDIFARRLVDWRLSCERRFNFNATEPIPASEIQQLNARMNTIRNNLVSDLKQGPANLTNLAAAAKSHIARFDSQIDVMVVYQAQAIADMRIVQK